MWIMWSFRNSDDSTMRYLPMSASMSVLVFWVHHSTQKSSWLKNVACTWLKWPAIFHIAWWWNHSHTHRHTHACIPHTHTYSHTLSSLSIGSSRIIIKSKTQWQWIFFCCCLKNEFFGGLQVKVNPAAI